MTEPNQLILETPADREIVRRAEGNGAAVPAVVSQVPSVESMLMLAIEQKVDPANLERLVALHERVMAQRAEQAFNAAMAAFRAECPAIVKNRTATDPEKGRDLYRFADLSEITTVIDPILYRNGLTYTWDTDMQGEQTVVTCIVSHVDGHKRSSKFTCKGSGTRIMNAAQVAASAVTFGRRYSLVLALGLTIDEDDDGRRAAPREAPPADPTQPRVPTRAERQNQPPAVTAKDLNDLLQQWRARAGKPQGTLDEFVLWAAGVLNKGRPIGAGMAESALLKGPRNWTPDDVQLCRDTMA